MILVPQKLMRMGTVRRFLDRAGKADGGPANNAASAPPQNPPVTEAKTETDRYTTLHERYEKAWRISRAGYAVYFLWVGLGLAAACWFFAAWALWRKFVISRSG